ncbi:MAG: hypothetical protein N3J91_06950 [Verrucomicrobiae bacterium]|nr:hypothetical protein [Verrucomicrobiae bacterium]
MKLFLLRALREAQGQPLTEAALVAAVQAVYPESLVSTVREVLRGMEREGYLVAVADDLTGMIHYGLTRKGEMRAALL